MLDPNRVIKAANWDRVGANTRTSRQKRRDRRPSPSTHNRSRGRLSALNPNRVRLSSRSRNPVSYSRGRLSLSNPLA